MPTAARRRSGCSGYTPDEARYPVVCRIAAKTSGIGEFFEQHGTTILAAAGALCIAAYVLGARHPVVLIVGIALLVIAALLYLGVI